MARRAVAMILKGRGFVVSEADTVAGAVSALAHRPDWVLLDLMLPDGCGTQVLRKIKEGGGGCRVCLVTGCGPAKLAEARALGPDAVFKKPVDVDRLLAVLTA